MGLTQIQSEGIGDGEVKSADLENSGVSAGTYGSSSAIPAITVDAKGRITSASTSSIDSTSIANGTSNVSVVQNGDINLTSAGTLRMQIDSTGAKLPDNQKLRLGGSSDLQIFHDGSNSYIKDIGTGGLILETNGHSVDIKHGSEYCARFKEDADVELYHDNSKVFETFSGGCNVIGELECDSLDVDGAADISGTLSLHSHLDMQDNDRIRLGSGDDFELYHNGSQNLITSSGQTLEVRASTFLVTNSGGTENVLKGISDGACELYNDSTKRLETTSYGVHIFGGGGAPLRLRSNQATGNNYVAFDDSSGSQKGYVGYGSSGNDVYYIVQEESADIEIYIGGGTKWRWTTAGHFQPAANNSYDIGSSSNRVRNLYTNDLNLSNEGSANDVDGTWGNYTIQEGEDDLFLLNRRNGKKYKFNLTEVN